MRFTKIPGIYSPQKFLGFVQPKNSWDLFARDDVTLFLPRKNKENTRQEHMTSVTAAAVNKAPLAVTLLSGFLGAGKTSVMKNILTNRAGLRCAVIVNEITEENIDAYALGGTTLLREKEQLVEMSNGCVCCTLRGDLIKQLRELAKAVPPFDCVLIESSGISEPLQVAQTFVVDLNDGLGPLNDVARLDTCVTVVDASTMMERLKEEHAPGQRVVLAAGAAEGSTSCTTSTNVNANAASQAVDATSQQQQQQQQQQSIGQLLAEQIEFSNVVLLNKIDRLVAEDADEGGEDPSEAAALVRHREVQKLVQVIQRLNPVARVLPTVHARVPLDQVLNTGLFTEQFAASVRGWMTDLPETHVPETEEYGVGNFIFRSKTPFHPLRLHQWLTSMWLLDEMKEDEEEDDDGDHDSDSQSASSSSSRSDEIESPKKRRAAAQAAAALLAKQKKRVRATRSTRYGGEILRCKGFAWIGNCSRLGFFVTISGAGDTVSFLPGGGWSTFPARASTGTTQMEPCQMLAFLGQYLDKPRMQRDLEALLLTEQEVAQLKQAMMANTGSSAPPPDVFDDPFVAFGQEDDSVHDHDHAEGHHHQHHHHRGKKRSANKQAE